MKRTLLIVAAIMASVSVLWADDVDLKVQLYQERLARLQAQSIIIQSEYRKTQADLKEAEAWR